MLWGSRIKFEFSGTCKTNKALFKVSALKCMYASLETYLKKVCAHKLIF